MTTLYRKFAVRDDCEIPISIVLQLQLCLIVPHVLNSDWLFPTLIVLNCFSRHGQQIRPEFPIKAVHNFISISWWEVEGPVVRAVPRVHPKLLLILKRNWLRWPVLCAYTVIVRMRIDVIWCII